MTALTLFCDLCAPPMRCTAITTLCSRCRTQAATAFWHRQVRRRQKRAATLAATLLAAARVAEAVPGE